MEYDEVPLKGRHAYQGQTPRFRKKEVQIILILDNVPKYNARTLCFWPFRLQHVILHPKSNGVPKTTFYAPRNGSLRAYSPVFLTTIKMELQSTRKEF